MKTALGIVAVGLLAAGSLGQDLSEHLQQGLFEEEANRDLKAAIEHYQQVVRAGDEQRRIIATALHRLAECQRKLGNEEKARELYAKLSAEYPEQAEEMIGTGATALSSSFVERVRESKATGLERELLRARSQFAEIAKLLQTLESKPSSELRKVLPTAYPDMHLDRLLSDLHSIQRKYSAAKMDHSDEHPVMQSLVRQIGTINTAIENRIEGVLAGLRTLAQVKKAAVDYLEKELGKVRSRVEEIPTEPDAQPEFSGLAELLENSPDLLNAPATNGLTFLQHAADTANLEMLKWLIDRGADLEIATNGRGTALHIAVENGYRHIAEALLEAGADMDAKDAGGRTPLHIAAQNGFTAVAELLLEHGADVNARSNRLETPLYYAAQEGRTDMVRLLLAKGAEIDARQHSNETALIIAAKQPGNVEIVRALLDAGADPAAVDAQGFTAFHYAVNRRDPEIAKVLIKHGAPVNAVTDQGRTPLNYAGSAEHIPNPAREVLIEAGGVALRPYTVQFGDDLEKILAGINEKLQAEGRPVITMQELQRMNPKVDLSAEIPSEPPPAWAVNEVIDIRAQSEEQKLNKNATIAPGVTINLPVE